MDQKGRISKRLLFEFWCLEELPLRLYMAIYMEVNRTLLEPKCALGSNCARQGHHHRGLTSQEIHYNAHEFVQLEIWKKKIDCIRSPDNLIVWSPVDCDVFRWSGRKSWSSLKHPEPVVLRSEPTSDHQCHQDQKNH